jgi:hypothetical protein
MAEASGAAGESGGRGLKPRVILAPVLAWLVVACVLGIYLNQRGRWRALAGPEAYRDCFGSPPAEGLRLLEAASFRHYRYTGEMLGMECYVRAEGEFDASGPPGAGAAEGWRDAPILGGNLELQTRLDGRRLTRVPDWFLRSALPDSARVREDGQGRWLYIHAIGSPQMLIAGGWRTTGR